MVIGCLYSGLGQIEDDMVHSGPQEMVNEMFCTRLSEHVDVPIIMGITGRLNHLGIQLSFPVSPLIIRPSCIFLCNSEYFASYLPKAHSKKGTKRRDTEIPVLVFLILGHS